MQQPDAFQLSLQGRVEAFRQQGNPILCPLAVTYDELPVAEVEVFDTQSKRFEQTQARTVKQLDDEQRDTGEVGKHRAYLGAGKHDRQPPGTFGPDVYADVTDFPVQHVAVQEDEGAQGLVLCRSSHLPHIGRKVQIFSHV